LPGRSLPYAKTAQGESGAKWEKPVFHFPLPSRSLPWQHSKNSWYFSGSPKGAAFHSPGFQPWGWKYMKDTPPASL